MASDPTASFFAGSSSDSFFDSLSASTAFTVTPPAPAPDGLPTPSSALQGSSTHSENNSQFFSLPSGWDTKISNDDDFFSSLSSKALSPILTTSANTSHGEQNSSPSSESADVASLPAVGAPIFSVAATSASVPALLTSTAPNMSISKPELKNVVAPVPAPTPPSALLAITPTLPIPPTSKPGKAPPPLPAGPYPSASGPPPLPAGPYPRSARVAPPPPVKPMPPVAPSSGTVATGQLDSGSPLASSAAESAGVQPGSGSASPLSLSASTSSSSLATPAPLTTATITPPARSTSPTTLSNTSLSASATPTMKVLTKSALPLPPATVPTADPGSGLLDFGTGHASAESSFFDSLDRSKLNAISLDGSPEQLEPAPPRSELALSHAAPAFESAPAPQVAFLNPPARQTSSSHLPAVMQTHMSTPLPLNAVSAAPSSPFAHVASSFAPTTAATFTPAPHPTFTPAAAVPSLLPATFTPATLSGFVPAGPSRSFSATPPSATFSPAPPIPAFAPPAQSSIQFAPLSAQPPPHFSSITPAAGTSFVPAPPSFPHAKPAAPDFSSWAPAFIPAPVTEPTHSVPPAQPATLPAPAISTSRTFAPATPPPTFAPAPPQISMWAPTTPPSITPPHEALPTTLAPTPPPATAQSFSSPSPYGITPPPATFFPPQFHSEAQPVEAPQRMRSTAQLSGPNVEPSAHPHAVMAFGFGGKVALIFPSQSQSQPYIPAHVKGTPHQHDPSAAAIRIVSMRSVLEGHRFLQTLSRFPGPLQASSSKDSVSKFISERVLALQSDPAATVGPRLEAKRLLWELLKISIKHYGNISRRQAASDENGDCIKSIEELLVPKDSSSFVGGAEQADAAVLSHATVPADPRVLVQVQQVILEGNVREAWKVALEARQWSHALVLARQVDDAAFQTTIAQLALSSFPDGSPLRALYLLFANSAELFKAQPQDSMAGSASYTLLDRWQENLAMLLASRKGDAASPAIGRLGDVLWARFGCVDAAHFCYLLADHALQEVDNPNSRLVLLGADHKLRRRLFVSAEALQRSEILEFSRKLGNSQYSAPTLHPYKLLYAALLCDFGLVDSAAKYLQQILPTTRGKAAQGYHALFIYHLNAFADRMAHSASGVSSSLSKTGKWKVIGSIGSGLGSLMSRGLNVLIGSGAEEDDGASAVAAAPSPFGTQTPPPVSSSSSAVPGTFVPEVSRSQQPKAPSKQAAKKEEKAPPPPAKPKPAKKAAEPESAAAPAEGGSGGWGGWLSWGKKAKNPVKLGKKMELEYNAELKQWIPKGADPAAYAASNAPPPPPSDAQLGAPTSPPAPLPSAVPPFVGAPPTPSSTSAPAPTAMAAPPPMGRTTVRAGQRRYLDTFQPDQVFGGAPRPASAPSANNPLPAFPVPPNLSAFLPPPGPPAAASFAAFMPPPQDAPDTGFQLPDFLAPPTNLEPPPSSGGEESSGVASAPVTSWPSDNPQPSANNRDWLNDS